MILTHFSVFPLRVLLTPRNSINVRLLTESNRLFKIFTAFALIKPLVLFSVHCFFKNNDLLNALDLPLALGCQGPPTFLDILSPSQSSGPLSKQPPTPCGAPGSAHFLATLKGGMGERKGSTPVLL